MMKFASLWLLVLLIVVNVEHLSAHHLNIDSLRQVVEKLPADSNRCNTLLSICEALSHSNIDDIQQYAQSALALSREIGFKKGEGKAYVYVALYYNNQGQVDRSIEQLLKALSLFEETGDTRRIAVCNNNIGIIYQSQNQDDDALFFFNKAYEVWSKENYKSGVARALYNIATVYEKKVGKDSVTLACYNRALRLNEEIDNQYAVSMALSAIGRIYFKKRSYDQALSYEERALKLAILTSSIDLEPDIYGIMSETYLALRQPARALDNAKLALETARKINAQASIADSYRWIYKAYAALDDHKNAFHYQSRYLSLHDSLKNTENISKIEKLRSGYEIEKKETEIASINAAHRSEIFKRNAFVAGCLALLIIGILAYSRRQVAVKKRLLLKRQRLELYTQQLIEKSAQIENISNELRELRDNAFNLDPQIEKLNKLLQLQILTDDDWSKFKKAFEEVYPGFFTSMRHRYPEITVAELRLSALIKLKLSLKDAASMLGISPESVKKSRYRLRKKFNLSEAESLEGFVEEMVL